MRYLNVMLICPLSLSILVPLQAAVKIDSTKRNTCDELNQSWTHTTDRIVLVDTSKWLLHEFLQNREVARRRGACPGGAEEFAGYATSSDRYSCAFGIICD